MWENISTTKVVESATYPFEGLNRITRGLRVGEIVTFCAGSGVGKSSVCRELAYHLIKSNEKVGYIALEESIKRTALGIMGIHAELPLHLLNPEEMPSEESLKASYDATIGSGNYVTYDHWGSVDSDNLINRIRYMNKALGCKWIFLDHVSIVVSGQDGDERKMIDILMTKLRSLVEETQVGMLLVSHLKRPEGRGFEEAGRLPWVTFVDQRVSVSFPIWLLVSSGTNKIKIRKMSRQFVSLRTGSVEKRA
jgi:twinkle protein